MVEFDIVMKSRRYTQARRKERHALLARDYTASAAKTRALSPGILYLAASIEDEGEIDYFDWRSGRG